MHLPRVRFTIRRMMVSVALASVALGCLAAYRSVQLAGGRLSDQGCCYSSLNNIAMAMHNYCESQGRFPRPFATDPSGRRTHSWRVIALPWFGLTYAQVALYDYAGRWDSPSNGKLTADVPGFLSCASEEVGNPHGSPFVMVNDFGDADPRQLPENAILVLEVWGANRNWLDPNDHVGTLPLARVGSTDHPGGFGVVLRDFTVTRIKDAGRIRKEGGYYVLGPEHVGTYTRRNSGTGGL